MVRATQHFGISQPLSLPPLFSYNELMSGVSEMEDTHGPNNTYFHSPRWTQLPRLLNVKPAAAQTHTTPSEDVIYQDRLFDDKFITLDPCYLYRQLFNLTRISMYFGYGFPFLVNRPQLIHYPRNNNAIDQGTHFTPKEICQWTHDQEHLLTYDTPPKLLS